MSILIVSDLTRGSGLFNTTQGAIATAVGLGASLSNAFAGTLLQKTNYNVAFLTLASLAVVALIVLWFFVPETAPSAQPVAREN